MDTFLSRYLSDLTAHLPHLNDTKAFRNNQALLALANHKIGMALHNDISYYLPDLDETKTIKASMLLFVGKEVIDHEHSFLFYRIYRRNRSREMVPASGYLRATIALMPGAKPYPMLVQHVEFISENVFLTEHTICLGMPDALAS